MSGEGESGPRVIPYRRVIVTPKDIKILLGMGKTAAYEYYKDIMAAKGRLAHQFITVFDFSEYSGIDVKIIYDAIPT